MFELAHSFLNANTADIPVSPDSSFSGGPLSENVVSAGMATQSIFTVPPVRIQQISAVQHFPTIYREPTHVGQPPNFPAIPAGLPRNITIPLHGAWLRLKNGFTSK